MKYRYYVHDNKNNVGVCEFSGDIVNIFIENLIDCVNWFLFESENTLDYKIIVLIDNMVYNFDFIECLNNGTGENIKAVKVTYTIHDNTISDIIRYSVNDYIKSHL